MHRLLQPQDWGSATMATFAVGVWLVSVVGADAMDRVGWRGPAEVLLCRLTYGTAGRPAPVEPISGRGADSTAEA